MSLVSGTPTLRSWAAMCTLSMEALVAGKPTLRSWTGTCTRSMGAVGDTTLRAGAAAPMGHGWVACGGWREWGKAVRGRRGAGKDDDGATLLGAVE
jgi:hypothetical protein